jgi:hypothetical protein
LLDLWLLVALLTAQAFGGLVADFSLIENQEGLHATLIGGFGILASMRCRA